MSSTVLNNILNIPRKSPSAASWCCFFVHYTLKWVFLEQHLNIDSGIVILQQLSDDACWRCIKQHSGKHKTAVTLVAWVSVREDLRNVAMCVTEKDHISVLWKFSSGTGSFWRFAVKIPAFLHKCFQPLQPVDVCPPQVAQIGAMIKLYEWPPYCDVQLSASRRSTQLWSHHAVPYTV